MVDLYDLPLTGTAVRRSEATPEDLITNWSAYISSYTGKLWPREVIEHWVNASVDRILDGCKPGARILEHGCGNGMLLFRCALHKDVQEVWGADLSGEACNFLTSVANNPHFAHIKDKIKVLHRPADNFEGIPSNHFDCIAMNAMVMYHLQGISLHTCTTIKFEFTARMD